MIENNKIAICRIIIITVIHLPRAGRAIVIVIVIVIVIILVIVIVIATGIIIIIIVIHFSNVCRGLVEPLELFAVAVAVRQPACLLITFIIVTFYIHNM